MDHTEIPRSIRFPKWLWDEIDRDAQRCKRSAVKQMEAVLSAYYRADTFGLDTDRLGLLARESTKGIAGRRSELEEIEMADIRVAGEVDNGTRKRKKSAK